MLHLLSMITAFSIVVTGIYVMAKGDWSRFALKFAGIGLSTTAALYLFSADFILGGGIMSCSPDMNPQQCLTFELYHVVRNIAFVIFHIAIGRDAIHFKRRERRGTIWAKNYSNHLPR